MFLSRVPLSKVGLWLCACAGALGVVGIVGNALEVEQLMTLIPGRAGMPLPTGVGLVLAALGTALAHLAPTPLQRALARALGAVVLLFGLLVVAEYICGVSLGVDWQLARSGPSVVSPARTSPLTAVVFVALGASMLLLGFESRLASHLRDGACVLAELLAAVGLIGHVFGVARFYELGRETVVGIALPSSLALVALGIACCLRQPQPELLRIAQAPGPGGVLLRRLGLLVLLGAPLLGGALITVVRVAHIHDLPLILAFGSVFGGACALLLLATTAQRLERSAEAAEQSRVRAQELFDHAAEGIFVADQSGRYTQVNAAGCRMLGCSLDEILGKSIGDFTPSADRKRLKEVREQLSRGGVHVGEWQMRRKDGTYASVEVTANILRDGRWQAFIRDIGERLALKRQLLESRDFLQRVLESSTEYGIVAEDLERRVVLWNEGARRSYGYALGEIEGHSSDLLVAPEQVADWEALHARAIQEGKAEGNIVARRKDGSTFSAKVVCTRRLGPDNATAGVVLVSRDLSAEQRRLAEEEFLSRVGVELASCLETHETLSRLAQLASGFLGDIVTVDIVRNGRLSREQSSERQPEAGLARALVSIGAAAAAGHPLQKVMETKRPLLLPMISEADRARFATSAEHARVLEAVRATSAMLVPMIARGQLLGVLSICARDGARTYAPDDLRLAMELARRAALTLDNVQLFQQSRLQGAMTMHLSEGAVLLRAADATIVYANPRFERMFGYPSGELLGQPMRVLGPNLAEAPGSQEASMAEQLHRSGAWQGELACAKKDGSSFCCAVSMSNFDHEQYGRVWIAVFTDITERKQLEEQTMRALHEKEVLLKEIHHRVKNNLQVISSLFSLQASRTDNVELRRLLDESRTRVASIALVHEQLYRSHDLAAIDFDEYLQELVAAIRSSYGVERVAIEVRARDVFLDIDQAVPCALMVCELVSNSLRHAFDASGGNVWVRAERDARGDCVLDIGDDGRGIDPSFDWKQSPSLGLRLVRGLATQLRATLTLDRTRGTRFTVRFAPSTAHAASAARALAGESRARAAGVNATLRG